MKKFIKSLFASGHKGLSFVELLVSVAILGVVGTVAASAMYVSTHQYTRGAAEVNIQNEAQLALNLLTDRVIDATSVTDDGSKITISKGTDNFVVELDATQNALVYTFNSEPTAILCGSVTGFSFDNTFADNRNVTFSVDFESNGRIYHAVTDTSSRNYSFVASDVAALADSLVITYDIPTDEVYMEPGMSFADDKNYKFNATVYGAYSGISQYGLDTLGSNTVTLTNGTGSVTLKIDPALPGSTTFPITVTTSEKVSGTFSTTCQFLSNSGVPASRNIIVKIRRVAENGFKFSGTTNALGVVELSAVAGTGTTGIHNSRYSANVNVTVENPEYNFGASYDNGIYVYKDPTAVYFTYAVKDKDTGSVLADNATVKSDYIFDLTETTSGTPSSSFALKKDLEDNEVLYVYAHSLHSVGYDSAAAGYYNKAANIIDSSTAKCYTNSGSQYVAIATVEKAAESELTGVGAGFQRGAIKFLVAELSDATYNQLCTDGLMRTDNSINYVVSLRYKVTGAANYVQDADHPYVLSITTSDPRSNPNGVFGLGGAFTSLFDCDKAYTIEVTYGLYVASGHTVTYGGHTYNAGEKITSFTSSGSVPAVKQYTYNSNTNYMEENYGKTEDTAMDFTSYPDAFYFNVYHDTVNVKGYNIIAPDGIEKLNDGGGYSSYRNPASIGKIEGVNDRDYAPNESGTYHYQQYVYDRYDPILCRNVYALANMSDEAGVIRFGAGSGDYKFVKGYDENKFPDPSVTYSWIQVVNFDPGTYRIRLAVKGYDNGGRYHIVSNGSLPTTGSPSGSVGNVGSPTPDTENLGYVYFKI